MARGKRKMHRMESWPIERRWAGSGGCDVLDPEADPDSPFELGYRIPHPTCHHWRQPVEIVPGVTVHASAHMDRPRSGEWDWPEIGLYLSERWVEDVPLASFHWAGPVLGPSAQIVVLPCPDGGCPLYEEETERVFAYALNSARAGRFVEVGCHAGHGRTGTALAALMILSGLDAETSMLRVWNGFCEQAIETQGQERYLFALARRLRESDDDPS
jgi:hypothetical protein